MTIPNDLSQPLTPHEIEKALLVFEIMRLVFKFDEQAGVAFTKHVETHMKLRLKIFVWTHWRQDGGN